MRYDTRMFGALLAALLLQLWPWQELTRDTSALITAAGTIALTLGFGWLGRRVGLHPTVVGLLQLVLVVLAAAGAVFLLHGSTAVAQLPRLPFEAYEHVRGGTAPLRENAGLTFALAVGTGAVALVADALAVGFRKPAASVLAPIALHLVTAFGLSAPVRLDQVVLVGIGIVLILLAASPRRPNPGVATTATAWLTTLAVGAASIGLAWGISQVMPQFENRRSNEPLQMNDPSLDLKRNLTQSPDDLVLIYHTDDDAPLKLKLATLSSLSSGGFGLSDVRVATGRMPAVPGNPQGTPRTTTVDVVAFRSEWLPVPYAPTGFTADGEWGFALDTLDVMALAGPNRTSATEGLSYTVESLDVQPDAVTIAEAETDATRVQPATTQLPNGVTARTRSLARDVTKDAPTPGAKALALESYLRSNRFTYSTGTGSGTGSGLATIDDFLFGSRRGYCEQFAGAMTIMAREVGIPARMAVGFVPGEQTENGWEVTARDLHTWPELWLGDLGWVAFEPTPSRGAPAAQDSATPSAPPSASPSASETAEAEPEVTPSEEPVDEAGAEEVDEGASDPDPTSGVLAVLPWLALAALAVAGAWAATRYGPRLMVARRRERRLAGTGDPRADTLAAWDEVRDSAADANLTWPTGSPRFASARFAEAELADSPGAADALGRLAAASERALYDRSELFAGQKSWRDEVMSIVAAIEARTAAQRAQQKARPKHARR